MQPKNMELARQECRYLGRRTFPKLASSVTAIGVFGGKLSGSFVYADVLGKEKRDKMTPDEILAELKRGNKNFSKGLRTSRNFINEQKEPPRDSFPRQWFLVASTRGRLPK